MSRRVIWALLGALLLLVDRAHAVNSWHFLRGSFQYQSSDWMEVTLNRLQYLECRDQALRALLAELREEANWWSFQKLWMDIETSDRGGPAPCEEFLEKRQTKSKAN